MNLFKFKLFRGAIFAREFIDRFSDQMFTAFKVIVAPSLWGRKAKKNKQIS